MNTELRWVAEEHVHVDRPSDWYWALGIATIACALIAILFSNVLFALLIVVASITLGINAAHPPRIVSFSLTEKGVGTDDEFHTFDEMLSFWVEESESGGTLFIDTPKLMTPDLIIPIRDVDPAQVRTIFKEAGVTERKMSEPLPHKILEFFGF